MWRRVHEIVWGAAHVERGSITWRPPLRAAIVATAVCGLAIAIADDPLAIPLTIGAVFTGLADTIESASQRMRSMLWVTVWITIGGLIGGLVSSHPVAHLIVLALLGAACGFAGSLGRLGGLAGVLTLVMAVLATGVPESAVPAVQFALLVLIGGLIQVAVTVVPDLIRRRSQLLAPPPAKQPVAQRLRAHFNRDDPMFRHAIRLGAALVVGVIAAFLTGWPHAYWIPLTIAWLSKPNAEGFGSRILARLFGTFAGIAASVLVIDVLHLHRFGFAMLVGVGTYVSVAFLSANYAIAVMGITAIVMALFTLIGDPVGETAVARAAATVIGSIIVVIGPLIYPPPKARVTAS